MGAVRFPLLLIYIVLVAMGVIFALLASLFRALADGRPLNSRALLEMASEMLLSFADSDGSVSAPPSE